MKIHIVQKGDTLWKIAEKYNVDFEQLKNMNTQLSDPDMIMPGMKIKIPSGSVHAKKHHKEAPKEAPIHKEAPVQKEEKMKKPTPPPTLPSDKLPYMPEKKKDWESKPEFSPMPEASIPVPPKPKPTPYPPHPIDCGCQKPMYQPKPPKMPISGGCHPMPPHYPPMPCCGHPAAAMPHYPMQGMHHQPMPMTGMPYQQAPSPDQSVHMPTAPSPYGFGGYQQASMPNQGHPYPPSHMPYQASPYSGGMSNYGQEMHEYPDYYREQEIDDDDELS